jgi:hypothetical protein
MLICPVGLVKPFLPLIRGERSHFVATETVAVLPPLQRKQWKQAAKGGVLCRGEQRESGRSQ